MFLKTDYEKFLIIFEEESLSRAADRLDTYQGALSKVLSRLESDVGESLFVRSHRGLVPTKVGHHLYTQLQQQVSLWDDFDHQIKNLRKEPQGSYRVGGHQVVLNQFAKAFSKVTTLYPKVNLKFQFHRSPVATRMVLNHELDFAIVTDANPFDELVIIHLKKECVALYGEKDSSNKNIIYYNPQIIYSQALLKLKKGIQLFPIEDYSMCCLMAREGKSTAILPESIAHRHGLKKKLSPTLFSAQISLVLRSDYKSQPGLNAILNEVRNSLD